MDMKTVQRLSALSRAAQEIDLSIASFGCACGKPTKAYLVVAHGTDAHQVELVDQTAITLLLQAKALVQSALAQMGVTVTSDEQDPALDDAVPPTTTMQ